MKILIVTGGYFPGKKYGGPPVSVDNFSSLMKDDQIYIVTVNHDLNEKKEYEDIHKGWNDRGNCQVLYLSDSEYNINSFEKIICEIQPDLIYLQSLFQYCVFPCLILAKKYRLKVLLAPRGELCAGALNLKKYKKIPYILAIRFLGLLRGVHYQSTSEEETAAIRKLLRTKDSYIHRLDNVPSIPNCEYPQKEKIPGVAKFIFLSRIHPKKNLLSAIEYLSYIKGDVQFDIYGPIEDKVYWSKCEATIKTLPNNVKVQHCGLVSHDEVHRVFNQYDAFLFPTFSENYGHVIAESLIVGCPVIISDQTPWNDVNEYNAGWAISLDKLDSFVAAIQTVVDAADNEMRNNAKRYAIKKSNIDERREKYNEVLCKIANISR